MNTTHDVTARHAVRVGALFLAMALVVAIARPALAVPSAPLQPASGPGGSDYQWASVKETYHDYSPNWYTEDRDSWTFEPQTWTGSGSPPTELPVVVVLSGWYFTLSPTAYMAHITHLVRKGNIVIFPRYLHLWWYGQTPWSLVTDRAIFSTLRALDWLEVNGLTPPNGDGTVNVGHSMGATIAANMAARWQGAGLPEPKGVVAMMSCPASTCQVDVDMSGIPTTTKFLCMVGDQDTSAGRAGCDTLWDRTSHIPGTNRNYIWLYGDNHGDPPVVADHNVPQQSGGTMTWYGTWKLTDGIRDCGFFGTNCDYALGNASQQTYMGTWSDGVDVVPLQATTVKP